MPLKGTARLFDRKKGISHTYHLKCPTCGTEHTQVLNEKPDSKWVYCPGCKTNRHRSEEGYGYNEVGQCR